MLDLNNHQFKEKKNNINKEEGEKEIKKLLNIPNIGDQLPGFN